MEWIIAFLSGVAVVVAYKVVTTALRRRKKKESKIPVPRDAHLMPWYDDPNGNPVYLGVVSEEHIPKVMTYYPDENNKLQYYDCHDEVLHAGDHVIRWPNPLTRRIHSVCHKHLNFPDVRKDMNE